jgi:hypothetical protein
MTDPASRRAEPTTINRALLDPVTGRIAGWVDVVVGALVGALVGGVVGGVVGGIVGGVVGGIVGGVVGGIDVGYVGGVVGHFPSWSHEVVVIPVATCPPAEPNPAAQDGDVTTRASTPAPVRASARRMN